MLIDFIIIISAVILLILMIALSLSKVPKIIYTKKVIYSDHKERLQKPLFSQRYGLAGKPDFILHTKDGLIPLEIKSCIRPNKPHFSHVMQLISYCLLIEEERGEAPKYGFIQYKDGKAFSVSYTPKMKEYLLQTMARMRSHLDSGKAPKPIMKKRCDNCQYRSDCFP